MYGCTYIYSFLQSRTRAQNRYKVEGSTTLITENDSVKLPEPVIVCVWVRVFLCFTTEFGKTHQLNVKSV